MKQLGLVFFISLLISSVAPAQVKYSNEFLSIGAMQGVGDSSSDPKGKEEMPPCCCWL